MEYAEVELSEETTEKLDVCAQATGIDRDELVKLALLDHLETATSPNASQC